jgi:hypothetical protein
LVFPAGTRQGCVVRRLSAIRSRAGEGFLSSSAICFWLLDCAFFWFTNAAHAKTDSHVEQKDEEKRVEAWRI